MSEVRGNSGDIHNMYRQGGNGNFPWRQSSRNGVSAMSLGWRRRDSETHGITAARGAECYMVEYTERII